MTTPTFRFDARHDRFFRIGLLGFAVGASSMLVAPPTVAQGVVPDGGPAQPGNDSTSPEVVPPELVERVEAEYPAEALALRLAARVVLALTIDRDGNVSEATVIEPAGHGFDEAARGAAQRMRFRPARRGDRAVVAKIRYPFVFEPPPEPPLVETAVSAAPNPAPAPPAPVEATEPAPSESSEPAEVLVRGQLTAEEQRQQSAEAVNVVDTRKAKQRTSDLGEVLARTQGVGVRRTGGLGSTSRFSLNGLYDDQVRFFLDAVPLDVAGYPFELVNVPVNLVDYIEVYRGVVPVRFGADALGGAVNLVTDQSYETRLAASYQVGSYGTYRTTIEGRKRDESGFVFGGSAFLDLAQNDYDVDVEVPDERGRLHAATVPRFHDAYRAYGATVEGGVVDKPWAKRLLLKGFASTYDKELQNNIVMTVPYGEVRYGESVYGTTARWDAKVLPELGVELVASYARRIIDYVDKAEWVYTWYGERIRARRLPGEVEARGHDQRYWQDGVFGRALVEWTLSPVVLRLSLSPTFTTRTGDERLQIDPDARDPLTAQRDLYTFVSGLEHEVSLFGDRLANIVFVKEYRYRANTEEPLPGGIFREREEKTHRFGVGDSLRYRFAPWGYAKASYEYATRLPRPDEVFGDGVLILANLELEPEVSHNANVGPRIELRETPIGDLTIDVNAFYRDSDRLIVLLGNDRFFTHQNVYAALGRGLENAASWSSPGHVVNLDGMLTWQDVRNASSEGTFGDFEGDRIPNRPYLFGSWGARLRFGNLPTARDSVEPFYEGRYVHEFFRGWESIGLIQYKQIVEAQVTHNAGVTWLVNRDLARMTSTFEIDNLTDARVYDSFGAQRPGRAIYLKMTGELR